MRYLGHLSIKRVIALLFVCVIWPLLSILSLNIDNIAGITSKITLCSLQAQSQPKQISLRQYLLTSTPQLQEDSLYYFQNPEDSSLYGVKNRQGEIIIPARSRLFLNSKLDAAIMEGYIELPVRKSLRNYNAEAIAIPIREVYNRQGAFLYLAQFFDNSSDYFEQGLRRYVDHQKMGFVDRAGNIQIVAQWDFVTPFHYGYAKVYTGGWKRKVVDKSDEHWTVQPTSQASTSYVINKQGKRVFPVKSAKGQTRKDAPTSIDKNYKKKFNTPKPGCIIDGQLYPYPFHYSEIEQRIYHQINQNKQLKRYVSKHLYSHPSDIHFEIVESPSRYFPFYVLQPYNESTLYGDITIYANLKGDTFYHYESFDELLTPLQQWLQKPSAF